MDAERFRAAVAHMRECQRNYFRDRDNHWLRESKAAERQVDKMLAESAEQGEQLSMFGDGGGE
jgi:hypothetical protein